MQHTYVILLQQLLLLQLLLNTHVCTSDKLPLQFNENGKFKIVQFTDLHYGYNEYENQQTAIVQGKDVGERERV
jgi:hypothetical protein